MWSPSSGLESDKAFSIHAYYDGEIVAAFPNDEEPFVIVQSGEYFITYAGIEKLSLKKGEHIRKDQLLDKASKILTDVIVSQYF